MVTGFNWGGWVTGGTADAAAQKSAQTAVVAALTPICVTQFQQATAASTESGGVEEGQFVGSARPYQKGGWASMPGSKTAASAA